MSLRTIVSIAASVIIGIACIATVSTDTFARDAGMTRLNHSRTHHHTINHGRAAHPGSTAKLLRWRARAYAAPGICPGLLLAARACPANAVERNPD